MSAQTDFIDKIAPIVQKMTAWYGYGVNSAIIAQACLESAYGTSTKAKHHNYFGLKYRSGRVTCSSELFIDGSAEQLADGSYIQITDKWYGFSSMEAGVEGYLQFIKIDNYRAAREQTDPRRYLMALKEAGYATSQKYVDNVMKVISNYNLTKYDVKVTDISKGAIKVIQKPAITHLISKYNHESRNGQAISYIVLHYTGNQTDTAKANANYFYGGNRGASAHYFVDEKSIWQSVEDEQAAWHVGKNYGSNNLFGKCTNKNSIGIEMCSSRGVITTATINNAVLLVKYLMERYRVPADRVVRHWDVCTKRCPGWSGWLPPDENSWADFKRRIAANTETAASSSAPKQDTVKGVPFKVRALTDTVRIYKGAGVRYGWTGKVTGKGIFTITEVSKKERWGKLKSGVGWIFLKKKRKIERL